MRLLNGIKKLQHNHSVEMKRISNKALIASSLIMICSFFTGCADLNFYRFDHYGSPAARTPYDKRYRKVREYLKEAKNHIKYKTEGKGTDYWQLPFETEYLGTGDCEDKAIWLYSKLLKEDIGNIRLVVGKYKVENTSRHVWINWFNNNNIYIIDPTMDVNIWRTEQYPPGYYQPLYSYYKNEKWKHTK